MLEGKLWDRSSTCGVAAAAHKAHHVLGVVGVGELEQAAMVCSLYIQPRPHVAAMEACRVRVS